MTRDETIGLLRRYEDDIRGFAVTGLYLFGSTVRGEAGPPGILMKRAVASPPAPD
jgi:predicted nucleotidyltransferase